MDSRNGWDDYDDVRTHMIWCQGSAYSRVKQSSMKITAAVRFTGVRMGCKPVMSQWDSIDGSFVILRARNFDETNARLYDGVCTTCVVCEIQMGTCSGMVFLVVVFVAVCCGEHVSRDWGTKGLSLARSENFVWRHSIHWFESVCVKSPWVSGFWIELWSVGLWIGLFEIESVSTESDEMSRRPLSLVKTGP